MRNDRLFRPSRRGLLGAAAALPFLAVTAILRAAEPDLSALSPMTADAIPISRDERATRVERAQKLMKANGIGAVLIEPGASLIYFTGIQWHRSERLTCAILPAEGEACIVTPFFEEPSVRETLDVPGEVRVWQEDEDPLKLVAGFLRAHKLDRLPIGIEETLRYFAVDRLQQDLPGARVVSANPVVRGCRMIKTPAELALMQKATDITIAAYRWVHPRVEKGLTGHDIAALMDAATAKLGGENKEYDCNGQKFTINPVAECASSLKAVPAGCSATYGDIEDCAEAQSDDFCGGKWVTNAGCQKALACDMVSTM